MSRQGRTFQFPPSRLRDDEPRYTLNVHCDACNRDPGFYACDLCCRIEYAERSVNGKPSPQLDLAPTPPSSEPPLV